jgi:hypothetical protein
MYLAVRTFLWKYWFRAFKNAVAFTQSNFRRRGAQNYLKNFKSSLTCFQSSIRSLDAKREYLKRRGAIIRVQSGRATIVPDSHKVLKTHLQRIKFLLLSQLSYALATKLAVLPYPKLMKSVLIVQSSFKMFVARKKYLKVRALVSLLQAGITRVIFFGDLLVSKKKSALRNLKELQYGIVKKLERLHPVLPRSLSTHLMYEMPLPPLPQHDPTNSDAEDRNFINGKLEQHETTIVDHYTEWVKSMPEIKLHSLNALPSDVLSSSTSEKKPRKVVSLVESEPLLPPLEPLPTIPKSSELRMSHKREPQHVTSLSPILSINNNNPDLSRRGITM